ncbi:hypothetical protein D3C75_1172980 [compost metagenome]
MQHEVAQWIAGVELQGEAQLINQVGCKGFFTQADNAFIEPDCTVAPLLHAHHFVFKHQAITGLVGTGVMLAELRDDAGNDARGQFFSGLTVRIHQQFG